MHRIYIHPLPIRIWHWLNAAGFIAMILTGVQIRYVGVIDVVPFQTAVRLHNWVGFALIANFAIWLVYYAASRRKRCYIPDLNPKRFLSDSLRQVRYYCYGMFKDEPNPHKIGIYSKFNSLQVVMYLGVMVLLLPVQFYTGLLLWDVERFSAQLNFWGGLRVVDTVHVAIFIVFVAYILIHPYLGTLGASRIGQYKAMITGYEEAEDAEEANV